MCRLREKKRALILVGLLFLDQGSKYLALHFQIGFVNPGLSFGLFPWLPVFFYLILNFLIIFFLTKFKKSPVMVIVLAGGLSNLFDRIVRGGVVDFVSLGPWPVFNLADIMIVGGTILFGVDFLFAKKI